MSQSARNRPFLDRFEDADPGRRTGRFWPILNQPGRQPCSRPNGPWVQQSADCGLVAGRRPSASVDPEKLGQQLLPFGHLDGVDQAQDLQVNGGLKGGS